MSVKCLSQEHNTMSSVRDRTRTIRSGDERTNHEAEATTREYSHKARFLAFWSFCVSCTGIDSLHVVASEEQLICVVFYLPVPVTGLMKEFTITHKNLPLTRVQRDSRTIRDR